ncbi:MAG: accessory Sec system protein Asp3 [Agathobacter sp.]|nr:accessory Sec system protein Asp3 [Agathobacter sp.]
MKDDTWVIRWREFLSDTYVYGSKIEFLEDQSVVYQNRLMPPGTVIHRWYSKTNFQRQRVEPTLPLIDGERAYEITSDISYNSPQSRELMLRIVFYDRYDVEAESIIVRNGQAVFKPSIKTYSYCVELINGGNADFTFRSLILREISKEEYDVRQERIKKLKESASKSKKKRGKNKKSE